MTMKTHFRNGSTDLATGFGVVTPAQRQAADRFLEDLLGRPRFGAYSPAQPTTRPLPSGGRTARWGTSPQPEDASEGFQEAASDSESVHSPYVEAALENVGEAYGDASDESSFAFGEDAEEGVPRAVAPHILDFRATTIRANDPLAFRGSLRDQAVEMMRKLEDLGIGDTPAGRRDAYVDAIAWNEPDNIRQSLRTCPSDPCLNSSCALVVRSLWRLLGARGVLAAPYRVGSAMSVLQQFARTSGALKDIRTRQDFDAENVRPGDVVFINLGNRQHVFMVLERNGDQFVSIDGGQGGTNDGGCCSIKRRVRTLTAGARTFAGDDRPITALVNLDLLVFTARLIDLQRNTPVATASAAGATSPATSSAPRRERAHVAESTDGPAPCGCGGKRTSSASEMAESNPPSLDEIVVALDRIAGTSLGTFAAYRATLVDGTLFGQRVQGLHPTFLHKLQTAEADAQRSIGGAGVPAWGVTSIGGFDLRRPPHKGWHPWGLAIDMNYATSPFIMHEVGETALDAQLGPVYHRIARLILGRTESVIPREITRGARSAARTARLYDLLAEENTAMIAYFAFLRTPANLDAQLRTRPLDSDGARAFFGDTTAPTSANVLRRIMRDYVVLSGREGPAVPGETYPSLAAIPGADRPFAGANANRDPLRGFLSIRREIVLATATQSLRWGAIDFGGQSGDVMHFDDGDGTLARQIASAKTAATT